MVDRQTARNKMCMEASLKNLVVFISILSIVEAIIQLGIIIKLTDPTHVSPNLELAAIANNYWFLEPQSPAARICSIIVIVKNCVNIIFSSFLFYAVQTVS